MRTVPGSEIVGSAELRGREHKKKTKERKKEKSQKRGEETGERKGDGACNLCQLFACLTLSRQFSPIISKPGTGCLTIRIRVVPHFSSGIVEHAKRERT